MLLRQIEKFFNRIRKIIELLNLSRVGFVESGSRAYFWLILGVCAGLGLFLIEGIFIKQIQNIIQLLNHTTPLTEQIGYAGKLIAIFDTQDPKLAVLLLVITSAFRALVSFINILSPQVIEKIFSARMRKKLIYFFLHESEGKVLSTAEIGHYIGELLPKASQFMARQHSVISSLCFIFTAICVLIYLSWQKMLLAILGFLGIFLVLTEVTRKSRSASMKQLEYSSFIFKHLDRIANNYFMVRTMRTADAEHRQLLGQCIYQSSNLLRATFFQVLTHQIAILLGGLLLCALIAVELLTPYKTGASFIVFLYLLIRLIQKIGELTNSLAFMNSEYPNFYATVTFFGSSERELEFTKRYLKYIKFVTESRPPRKVHVFHSLDPDKVAMTKAPVIDIKNLSFSYSRDLQIFSDFSLEIKSGEFFGLIGKSGSGKSTLLALLLGLIQPQKGKILIDNVNAEDFYRVYYFPVSYAGPDPYLFPATLKEILDYGRWREYTQEDYEEAMFKAKFLPVFKTLGSDLNWQYHEHDNSLSTGEKQRLSLTRAFLLKPKLLILDEVTANLDSVTENDVLESLNLLKGETTILMISHRKNALKGADRIFDVSKKEFVSWNDINQ